MEVSILRPLIVQGLLNSKRSSENKEFKHWISNGQYLVLSVPSGKELEIGVNNDDSFRDMLAYDCCRMASASFETMQSLHVDNAPPKSFAWQAIKSYYAAFFAAHSILRCFGVICSQLERGHVTQINQFAQANGLSSNLRLEGGIFVGKFDQARRCLNLKKANNSHQDIWAAFAECLSNLSNEVLSVPGLSLDKQRLSDELDSLATALKRQGRNPHGDYLSDFRNRLNYRHEFDAWYPYGKSSLRTDKVHSLLNNWSKEELPFFHPWKESSQAHAFFVTCIEVINMCYKLITLIDLNSASRNNLYRQWPVKLFNLEIK